MESVIGLKESFPEKAIAVTIVGDARKFIVSLLPSLRDLKLRLNDVRIAFSSPFLSSRLHCPMQGPQAFASTVAPTSSNADVTLSRSIVARICSDPGVHKKGTFALSPASFA